MLVIFQRSRTINPRDFEVRVDELHHYALKINNRFGEPLRVGIVWQTNQGPRETSSFTEKLQSLIETRYWFMSGICAGVRDDVKLGDVIIADKGCFSRREDGRTVAT